MKPLIPYAGAERKPARKPRSAPVRPTRQSSTVG